MERFLTDAVAFSGVVKKKKERFSEQSESTSSTSSRLSTRKIKDLVERLRLQSHWDLMRKNYYSVWKIFSKFYLSLDVKPRLWEDRLVLFVGHLVNNNKQSSTIKSYMSAIKYVLKEDKIEINENQFLIQSLTKACKLINNQVTRQLPIQKDLLGALLRKIK